MVTSDTKNHFNSATQHSIEEITLLSSDNQILSGELANSYFSAPNYISNKIRLRTYICGIMENRAVEEKDYNFLNYNSNNSE